MQAQVQAVFGPYVLLLPFHSVLLYFLHSTFFDAIYTPTIAQYLGMFVNVFSDDWITESPRRQWRWSSFKALDNSNAMKKWWDGLVRRTGCECRGECGKKSVVLRSVDTSVELSANDRKSETKQNESIAIEGIYLTEVRQIWDVLR